MEASAWVRSFVIVLFAIVSSLITMLIMVAAVWDYFTTGSKEVPEVISNWGGVIIGFFFGSYLTLMAEWLFKHGNGGTPDAKGGADQSKG